jgi:hypothetical protein
VPLRLLLRAFPLLGGLLLRLAHVLHAVFLIGYPPGRGRIRCLIKVLQEIRKHQGCRRLGALRVLLRAVDDSLVLPQGRLDQVLVLDIVLSPIRVGAMMRCSRQISCGHHWTGRLLNTQGVLARIMLGLRVPGSPIGSAATTLGSSLRTVGCLGGLRWFRPWVMIASERCACASLNNHA